MARKSGLGRGYEALLSDNANDSSGIVSLRISEVEPNADQPRKVFDQAALDELSENIKQFGLLQPIVVRPLPSGMYQIVAGERRWRASRQAGLNTISAVIRELSDEEAAQVALIENLQRENLNAIEEAHGYKLLMERFGMTQEEVAAKVGKSRPAVANALRLLELGDYARYVEDGTITAGHGRALLSLPPAARDEAIGMIRNGASVRQIENFSKEIKRIRDKSIEGGKNTESTINPAKPTYFREIEAALKDELGRRVKVNVREAGGVERGTLEIEFFSREDLAEMITDLFGDR